MVPNTSRCACRHFLQKPCIATRNNARAVNGDPRQISRFSLTSPQKTATCGIEDVACSQAGLAPVSGGVERSELARERARTTTSGEGHPSMLHVTCDVCGKELRAGEDQRYVVKIEAFAAHDPSELTDADLDDDHM